MSDQTLQAYADLSPSAILDALEAAGFTPDGRITALNSYENRVYQLGLEGGELIVAKFYRPGRWSDETIAEEHEFARELAAAELPVVAPLELANGQSLIQVGGHRLAVFPSIGGRPPALDDDAALRQMGRLIARLHNIGALKPFRHRREFDPGRVVEHALASVEQVGLMPDHLMASWAALSGHISDRIQLRFQEAGELRSLRIHGDCHPGNVLWRDDGPWLLDLDDACNGPAIQDLWMYLSGDRDYQAARLAQLLAGYTAFREFDQRELSLIEALRTLRLLHFLGWIAERWADPAFPRAFPDFGETGFWERQVLSLQEQLGKLDEPPLEWHPAWP
ncbi:serine/threonine protein kinase [Gammaproteobacteria bacterium AB-CW1]|uniref:Stress response kinase A n=1 Tax=Natronospira elongata TaxID=3110268 RepID=A0AAP6JEL1_9GAMM|nr:serine/threonine protein kinase [Gammaproteobacteria bacterium AB-CW1]